MAVELSVECRVTGMAAIKSIILIQGMPSLGEESYTSMWSGIFQKNNVKKGSLLAISRHG